MMILATTFLAGLASAFGVFLGERIERQPVRLRPLLAVGVLAALLVTVLLRPEVTLSFALWTAVFFVLLAALATIDALTETVPDVLTLGAVAVGLFHASMQGVPVLPFGLAAGALITVGILQGQFTNDAGWIGSGDLFLFAVVTAWFGPGLAIDVLLAAFILLGFQMAAWQRDRQPFAPAIALASSLIWLGGPIL